MTIVRDAHISREDDPVQLDPFVICDVCGEKLLPARGIVTIVRDAHISREDDPVQLDPFVICDVCGEKLCTVEEGDSISVLASVVADHECGETLPRYGADFPEGPA